ncbi:MAG TPA: hypothetical protein VF045_00355 [Acidimicrobiales bacterium]
MRGPGANLRPGLGPGTRVLAQQQIPNGCQFRNGNFQCSTFLQGRNFTVSALRWWSTKNFGMRSTFQVESGAVQEWQNGSRVGASAGAGAFGVSGTTSRTVTSTQGTTIVDIWPERGECWGLAGGSVPPANSYNCGHPGPHLSTFNGNGYWGAYGNDAWRWEQYRWDVQQPSGFRYSYVEEIVRNVGYIGGTAYVHNLGPLGFNERSTDIRANQWGWWSQHFPGAQRIEFTEGEVSVTGAAQFEIKAAIGSFAAEGSFSSASTQKNRSKVAMHHRFINNFEHPGYGMAIRYDRDFSKRYEYWSCQLHQGWSGGAPCWTWPGDRQTTL